MKKIVPPKWAARFLSWYCRPELLEDLLGDINEYFDRNVSARGPVRAKLIFIFDVFKFIRPYTVRQPDFLHYFIQWIMIRSYIKTSSRSIARNKLFSSINIVGLAVSMSVGLLMISFLSDLFSYDDFHQNKNRIYRIITHDERAEQPPMDLASTTAKAAKLIAETMTGVEHLSLIRSNFSGDANTGEKVIPLSGLWADNSFLQIMSFPLVHGNKMTALKEPYSLVLTETSANKLFGASDAVGRSVKFDSINYTVTGVLKDIPKLSHLHFEALVSYATAETLYSKTQDGGLTDWSNVYMSYIYLLLPENGDPTKVQADLDRMSAEENNDLNHRTIMLSLQPMTKIVTGKHLSNQLGPVMNRIAIWVLVGLALVVLLSACFNYTNLSIARSMRRSREVGIRKVIGALRSHVLGQFITESVIISLLSLAASFLIFLVLRQQFVSLHSFISSIVSLELSVKTLVLFIALAVGVGIVAGFLPALFFSRINTIQVLKNVTALQVFRHVSLRKALIVVQYVFSLMFISATTIGYQQYEGFLAFDLGFSTENILNIRLNGASAEQLVKGLSELPEVTGSSRSVLVTSLGSVYEETVKYKDPNDSVGAWTNHVDENYIPLHRHQLVAGRNFNHRPPNSTESEVLVNETFLKRFNIGGKDPNKALGEVITIAPDTQLTIVGVLKDFHYETVEDGIEPTVMRNNAPSHGGYINARINTTDWTATREKIEAVWHQVDPLHKLDANFYNDQIEEAYSQFSVMLKVIGFLAFLAICISSMGLFGMVVFTTETRIREVSIRKVFGATEWKLIYLLSRGFLLLLGTASMIALPVTYIFFDQVVLSNFAFHQPIAPSGLLLGVGIVMLIAFGMTGLQTIKVARSNPAAILKNE